MVPDEDKFNVRKYGSMKDWSIFLRAEGVDFEALKSEDKLKELEMLSESGLPYEHFKIFSNGISYNGVADFIKEEGSPFWVSLCPKKHLSELRRHFKLGLTSFEEVKSFIEETGVKVGDYHVVLSQYPSEIHFVGSAIFNGCDGIIEFMVGEGQDRLARGSHTPDQAIVKNNCFEKYSSVVNISTQRAVAKMLLGRRGYFEFGKGVINKEEEIRFFAFKNDKSHLNYFKQF